MSPTADPGITSLIPARSHTFMEIDQDVFLVIILLLLIQEGYVEEALVRHVVKLVQEKNTLRLSNDMDPDPTPELGPYCLQRLSADEKSCC